MESSDREINFRTVAAEARVSTAWLCNQKELRNRIMRSRETPIWSVSRDSGGQCHKCLAGQRVIATLRLPIKTLEAKNPELTEQLEHAYGMIAEIGQVVPSTTSRQPMMRYQSGNFEIAIVQSRSRSRILVTHPSLAMMHQLKASILGAAVFPLDIRQDRESNYCRISRGRYADVDRFAAGNARPADFANARSWADAWMGGGPAHPAGIEGRAPDRTGFALPGIVPPGI
jgi:hypothetical protein